MVSYKGYNLDGKVTIFSEGVKVLLLKHRGMERRDDQRRRKRDMWTCSLSRDDDIGSTWSSGMVGLNSSMAQY